MWQSSNIRIPKYASIHLNTDKQFMIKDNQIKYTPQKNSTNTSYANCHKTNLE